MKVLNITSKLPNVTVALLKRYFQNISGKAESQDHPQSPKIVFYDERNTQTHTPHR